MYNKLNSSYKNLFPISIILILTLSRLIPHPSNFTPLIAIAILSTYLFANIYISLIAIFISMFLSDIFIGFYNHMLMLFVYGALFFISYFIYIIKIKINFKNLFIFCFGSSLIFFLVSNFGVWFSGTLYEKNLNGLINCYILAIPFFKNTFLSTTIFAYSALVFSKFSVLLKKA